MNPEADAIDAEYQQSLETGDSLNEPDFSRFVDVAAQAYKDSTDYYESSLYDRFRASLAHFRSEHAPGSKYHNDAYKHRSKVFRPKPRSAVRALEANAATALFTNDDLINVAGVDPNNQQQALAAEIHKAILQFRLENSIPWFLTAIGAYQDCNVIGICISRQEWKFEKKLTGYEPALDELGNPLMDEDGMMLGTEVFETAEDRPEITLIPADNFRFDGNADWRDVVGTSPYLIELMPMYAGDVKAMGDKGEWNELTLGQIIANGKDDIDQGDTVKKARYGQGKSDPADAEAQNEFTLVWVRRVILRLDGEDWYFLMLGDKLLLTDPKPLEEVYPHGRELYAVGFSIIETHKTHPSSAIELSAPLTELLNEVTNQRIDNVKLALNRRYKLRRGAKIDLGALMRNVPGGGVMMDDVEKDIAEFATPDVTQSSYVEQDRISVEADELTGNFSQGSVQTNRTLNETVGGMNLMSASANQVQELQLRTFIETWVEPVLRTMTKLESLYETDETVLALAAGKAEYYDQISDELMMQDLVVRVNVGMGNTNPQQKLERFMMPLNASANLPEFAAEIDYVEVGKEIWALSGQGDGSRFMLTPEKKQQRMEQQGQQQDPRVMVEQMRQEFNGQIAQLKEQAATERKAAELQSRERIEAAKIQSSERIAQYEGEIDQILAEMRHVGDKDTQFDALKTRLAETTMKLATTKQLAGMKAISDQLPTPPVEPPQRAAPGMSYQQ